MKVVCWMRESFGERLFSVSSICRGNDDFAERVVFPSHDFTGNPTPEDLADWMNQLHAVAEEC